MRVFLLEHEAHPQAARTLFTPFSISQNKLGFMNPGNFVRYRQPKPLPSPTVTNTR